MVTVRNYFGTLIISMVLTSCSVGRPEGDRKLGQDESIEFVCDSLGTLLRFSSDEEQEGQSGYVNLKGDIIVPTGKYVVCYTDTIVNFGVVINQRNMFIGIDSRGIELFEIYPFDNGPDYISDGMIRVVEEGKIGYANNCGDVTVPATYEGAHPFENGTARVALNCTKESDGQHSWWVSDNWIRINKRGEVVD
jgi:WG containing repeat